mgnify:CR=1 FL=1
MFLRQSGHLSADELVALCDEVHAHIEKGIALIIPGYTPDTLGQVYSYAPSSTEVRVALGIFGVGFLLFTLMVKLSLHLLAPNHDGEAEPVPAV